MKRIGFIGGYDKTDLIIYIAKLLVENGLKVLIVDGTILQKTRYTVPCIEPSLYYITTYEDIDIAIGFENLENIKNYMGVTEFNYDIVFYDVDNREKFESLSVENSEQLYFVTAFDNYSIKKGLEIIGKSENKLPMTKIIFSKEIAKEDDEYLNFISFYYAVKWNKNKIYFPFENGDLSIIIDNQRSARISYKELSTEYKNGIMELISRNSTRGKNEWCKENAKKYIKENSNVSYNILW